MDTKFEWDEEKSLRNKLKHGISFDIAQKVFEDPFALSVQDRHENGEDRWQTLGMIENILLLLVAHTVIISEDSEVIRIISARRADRNERIRYEKQAY
jgi:uncharacterized DUF497 family protein